MKGGGEALQCRQDFQYNENRILIPRTSAAGIMLTHLQIDPVAIDSRLRAIATPCVCVAHLC
jgi:hypothetical protein